ncbi:response regulator [Cereibacter sphaeroides]|nr:response regulator [Cereibacter sphaeroides]
MLVVEDEPNISEAIRYILQRDGFSVTLLASGEGVLETIAAKDPALVILDAMLPGVSGLDILRAMRGQPGTAALPVILLTAKGSAQAREQAIEAGASLFMAKPFANAALLEAVRNLVEA